MTDMTNIEATVDRAAPELVASQVGSSEIAHAKPTPGTGRTAAETKIALVRGPIVSTVRAFNNEATPCIGFAYIAAYMKSHGYVCEIVDAIGEGLSRFWPVEDCPGYQCQGLTFDEVAARIPRDVDVIGFSGMFSGEWPVLRRLIKLIRARFPKALFVVGGEHITALSKYSLGECPEIDICVRGEGEHTFYEVVETYRQGGDYGLVAGIAFVDQDGNYAAVGELPRVRKIDSIPWPEWPDGYMERFWAKGKSYGVQSERDMPIMASRGCPYQCTFCSNPHMWTTRYILRSVDDLVAEIKSYLARYSVTALQFYDLTAITKKRWTIDFCDRLISEGIDIKWSLPSGTRSEALDRETLSFLKKTNCNYLVYAPESGSPETLEKIKKRIDLEKLTESVIEAKRQGIIVRTNLIIGFPHETRRNVFETIRYGLYLAWKGADEVSINIFSPYPGTEIFDGLIDQKKFALSDEFFLALTSLNSDYTSANPLTCNPYMGPRELATYRLGFMLFNYIVGYVAYPSRIIRTLRNVFSGGSAAATVLEHRLKDVIQRRSGAKN
jgi:anaerobic magnesium-protoporphyrin IX monomethyl ester cyclase